MVLPVYNYIHVYIARSIQAYTLVKASVRLCVPISRALLSHACRKAATPHFAAAKGIAWRIPKSRTSNMFFIYMYVYLYKCTRLYHGTYICVCFVSLSRLLLSLLLLLIDPLLWDNLIRVEEAFLITPITVRAFSSLVQLGS